MAEAVVTLRVDASGATSALRNVQKQTNKLSLASKGATTSLHGTSAAVKGLGASLFMRGSPFLNAAWNGDLDYIKNAVEEHLYAVENIGESPANSPLLEKDPFHHTPMMSATYRGHAHIVKYLFFI